MTRIGLTRFIAVALLLAIATSAHAQTSAPKPDRQHLQGGWVLTIAEDPGAPVVPPVQPRTHLILFTGEGGVVSQWNTVAPPGFTQTSGIGAWKRVSDNEFEVTQYFQVATVNAVGGHDVGYFTQRFHLRYGATTDELSGPADFALLDVAGNVVFSGQFFVTLRRIAVDSVGSPF
jgi:hypothetical protein